ncbi:MAG: ROK family transcriptional regulator [Cellulomonas sp.]|nr:ROK family transcriptional regulator [Cellulomonas sp.]
MSSPIVPRLLAATSSGSTAPLQHAGARVRTAGRAARQESLREHNLSLTLQKVVDAIRPVSRADISAATGLARATVSGLVDQLIDASLVIELAAPVTREARRVGRPAVPLAPARGTVAGVGMEVNVDYLGVRAVDLAGRVLTEVAEIDNFRNSRPEVVLDRLARIAGRVLANLSADGVRVAGTALALPGLVDRVTGPLRYAPNLGWRDVDVVGLLTTHPVLGGFPPSLANEANLAALAEAVARRDGGRASFVYVSGEVGIGGAIVLDGEIFAGRHGWSGEIGHTVVDAFAATEADDGAARAGRRTLEDYAGQDALMRRAGLDPTAPLGDLVRAAEAGDAAALTSLRRGGTALGVVLANVVNVVDVGMIVLGGRFSEIYPFVREAVEEQLERCVIFAPWSPVEVQVARAGEYPAMTGGAIAELRTVVADPVAWVAGGA